MRTLRTLCLLWWSAIFLGACSVAPQPAATPEKADLRLYVFDCGRVRVDDVRLFGLSPDDTAVRELFVPCYLIEHERGRLLWEAGVPQELATADGWVEAGFLAQRLDRTLASQLDALGLSPEDVDWLAVSHFHSDHVGAAAAFAGATLLIQQQEHANAFGPEAQHHFFDPDLYAALADGPRQLLQGQHDVFGDGRVLLLPAPGHTPGHQVLYVDLSDHGPLLLAGDVYHFEASRRLRAVPQFNHDREQTLRSMDRIEVFAEQQEARILLGHSLEQHEQLPRAPAYLQ